MNEQSTTQNDANAAILPDQPNNLQPIPSGAEKEIEPTEEEKELKQLLIPFERYPKLNEWVRLFTDKNNKDTYGNRTESAMRAYDCKDRASASAIGVQNFRKLRHLASVFVEDRGITIEKLLTVAATRAITSDNPEWFKLLASITDIHDPKAPSITVNNNTQNNQFNINGDEAENFSKKFKDFLEKE